MVVSTLPTTHDEVRYTLTEVTSLALEIQAAEGLDIDTALARAAAEIESLRYYAGRWDGLAVDAGTWDAVSSTIPF